MEVANVTVFSSNTDEHMELANGYRLKNEIKMKRPNREVIGTRPGTLLVIKLPSSIVLRILSRSLFLAMVILALPTIGPFLRGSPSSLFDHETIRSGSIDVDLVPSLFRDLMKEGLVNKVDRTLILSSDFETSVDYFGFFEENGIDLVIESNLACKSIILDETFDFVFALGSRDVEFEDRVLKIGGLLVVKLSDDPLNPFQRLSNYKIVYVRRFNSTIVAMKKTGLFNILTNLEKKVLICGPSEAKKAAMEDLEDPLLEPPITRELAKSGDYLKEINFLADLVGKTSLISYNRRIFITSENDNGSVSQWFNQNYPKKKQYFEVINKDRITDWIKRNVTEEDFVVMKADTHLVKEMMREKTICLVDELFLECEFQWQGVWEENKGKRTYWECLSLFGKLREEGVAVHQWWG